MSGWRIFAGRLGRRGLALLHVAPLVIALFAGIGVVGAVAIGLARGSRPIGVEVFGSRVVGRAATACDDLFPQVLFALSLAGAVAVVAARRFGSHGLRRRARREELALGRRLRRFGLAASVALFFFSLLRVWSEGVALVPEKNAERRQAIPDLGVSDYSALFGVLPWSDAHAYYMGARRLVDTGSLDEWNERRPLNASLLAVRLALTGFNLRAAIVLQAIVLALCSFLAASALGRRIGPWSGMASFTAIYAFARNYQPTVLSEALGLSLGALGVALLLDGVFERRLALAAGGLVATCLGMGARAGALLVIPCVLLGLFAFVKSFRESRHISISASILAAGIGIGWSPLVNSFYGTGAGVSGANFAYTACGLALGGSWGDAQQRYAEELKQLSSEREQARFLYREAERLIREDPRPLARALWKNERAFLGDLHIRVQGLVLPGVPRSPLANAFLIVLVLGLVRYWIARRSSGEIAFWVAGWVGLLLSVPFVFGDGGWRSLATSWPFLAAFVSTGLSTGAARWTLRPEIGARVQRRTAWACLGLVMAGSLVGPRLAWLAVDHPDASRVPFTAGPERVALVSHNDLNLAILVVNPGDQRPDRTPSVNLDVYRRKLIESGMEDVESLRDPPERPFAFAVVYDSAGHWAYQLIAPGALFDSKASRLRLRLEPWKGSRYFWRVVAWEPDLPVVRASDAEAARTIDAKSFG